MGFNMGMVVSYNQQNYVIIEIIEKEVTGGFIQFLKLKNLINQEILTVNSQKVNHIQLKGSQKNSEINFENELTDTSYIESLFPEILSDTDSEDMELFDLSGENTFTLDDVIFEEEDIEKFEVQDNLDSLTKESAASSIGLIQNFQTPETNIHLTPRRSTTFEKISPISDTFSNLKMVGELPTETTEIIPRRVLNEQKKQVLFEKQVKPKDSEEQVVKKQIIEQQVNQNNNVKKTENIEIRKEVKIEPLNQVKSNNLQKETINSNINFLKENKVQNEKQDSAKKLEKEAVEKQILEKQDSLNKLERNISNSSKEEQLDTLETEPLNTKAFFENFNKQKKLHEDFNSQFKNNKENTNTIFGSNNKFDQDALKNSRIYKKFKLMSRLLILFLVLALITPIIGIIAKAVVELIKTKTVDLKTLFSFDLSKTSNIAITAVSILMSTVFVIYLVIYLISISDKQYKKIAFYNFQLKNNIEIIDSIQEYNNESSIYLIKVHNEIKKMKKDIKKSNKQYLNQPISNNKQENQKVSH
ncbi:hypothetical protein [Spiroplasma floricola]|uniref:Transmembrane protein n=1 Tax=Spiroplasma floricola 23-6 TaxID=1336749 RepID=A0A2K8SDP6_9MOLU|nr:hypothetical protein [Spiroplasma floricola]AUB31358.1 hypothetical protein SFLOR_v1c03010 [Spiroplasma floricola 23-6]